MFAVFETSTMYRLGRFVREWEEIIMQKVIKRLASGIPDKIKFFMIRLIPISNLNSSEMLGVLLNTSGGYPDHLILDILNKRWQTLDLISMVEELRRSLPKRAIWERLIIRDRLSSRARFKKDEDLTDCA